MTEANIQIEDQMAASGQNIKIVKISGQLDESNVDEKIKEVYAVVEANPKGLNLVFDLGGLEYMNSKSIGYLTDLYGKITESGGKVAIAKAPANIIDILQVVGLTQLIQTFDTAEMAVQNMSGNAPAAPMPEAPMAAPAPEAMPAAMPEAPMAAPAPEAMPEAPAPEAPQEGTFNLGQ